VELSTALNLRELQRYLGRIGDRWPLQMVLLAGARVADMRAGRVIRDNRGHEFVVVLVSEGFDGMPWLERVHQAGALWDALEMGGGADIHCYTRRSTCAGVRRPRRCAPPRSAGSCFTRTPSRSPRPLSTADSQAVRARTSGRRM
jgi:hypothetical protein